MDYWIEQLANILGIGAVVGAILAFVVRVFVQNVVAGTMNSIKSIVSGGLDTLTEGLKEQNVLNREANDKLMAEMTAHDRRMADLVGKQNIAIAEIRTKLD